MIENYDLLEKIILNEIEAKNRAIHAYDGMVWKIRSGFLTLLFGGWSIMLKGILSAGTESQGVNKLLAWGLFLFSIGFSIGAWYVDRSYVRRKFRVIEALNRLTDAIRTCGGDYLKIPPELLKVAGDCAGAPFDRKSYREAARAELSIYGVPLLILALVIMLVVQ